MKWLRIMARVFLIACALFFSVALASCPPVAGEGHNYYFLPVAYDSSNFYMDEVIPSGPLMECNRICNFVTRPFARSQTVYGISAVIYVEYSSYDPLGYVTLFYCAEGWKDGGGCNWYHYTLIHDRQDHSAQITLPITAQTPGVVFEEATFLNLTIAYNFASQRPFDYFRILFGDGEHRSRVVTAKLELEGQPIPELPMPAISILISVGMVITVLRVRQLGLRGRSR